MRAEPFELIVVEDVLELQRVDQGRPRCSMRPVADLHGQAQPAIEHGGAEQAFGPPFGDDVRGGLHQRGVGTIPARDHVRFRSHRRGDATGVRLEDAPPLGSGEPGVDRCHRTKRHTVDGDPASVDPDVDRREPRHGEHRLQDLLLQRVGRLAIGLERPALCLAGGKHPRMFSRAVGVDVASLRIGRSRFVVPGTDRWALQAFFRDAGAGQQGPDGLHMNRFGVVRGTHHGDLAVGEVEGSARERDTGLQGLHRRPREQGTVRISRERDQSPIGGHEGDVARVDGLLQPRTHHADQRDGAHESEAYKPKSRGTRTWRAGKSAKGLTAQPCPRLA